MSVCVSVCLSVRLSVRLSMCSLFRYHLNVFLPTHPEVGCPIFLENRNPWRKVMERSGLRLEHFCLEMVLNRPPPQKKMTEKQGGNHASRWIKDLWSKGVLLILAYF